ncbi:MAG: histidine phosphatase family protein [Gammaproteobacteria bacterium]|nr:histidine phosphatase family protein [Gammaproteobacteria bacterium]
MELVLVRHAIAQERDARHWPDDAARPLSPKGELRARQACAGLRRVLPAPLRLYTSPLLRTRQTALLLSRYAGWPRPVACPELAPGTPPEELFALLRRGPQRLALVGHEPDLGELLALCVGARSAIAFKKMGVARVKFRGAAAAGRGQLLCLLPPRMLRASATARR